MNDSPTNEIRPTSRYAGEALSSKTVAQTLNTMAERFASGNSIPVERAHIKRHEWDAVVAERDKLVAALNRLCPHRGDMPAGMYETPCPRCLSDETAGDDARDAARYRFLRQPGNAIVYAKDRNAWGKNASGHVRWDTAEQLDSAVDAARGAAGMYETPCPRCLSDETTTRQPDGYAYRRHWPTRPGETYIAFDHGGEINGRKPVETVPYWLGPALPTEFPKSAVDCDHANAIFKCAGCGIDLVGERLCSIS